MRIPLNSLSRRTEPHLAALESCARRVVRSGHFILGPECHAFEHEFAAYCGVGHCIGVGNGTDALELAMRVAGIGTGSRIALVANAGMYATTAALACGAEPVFVDVERDSANMAPTALSTKLRETGGKVSAVVVTHLYGRLAAIPEILDIAREHEAVVIEDCAQAHGASAVDGKRAGTFGSISAFSFYPTKNLGALGDGGALVTSDPKLAARARMLRQYGWDAKYHNALPGGRNSRLDEMQAAFLRYLLPHLDGWNASRRRIAEAYTSGIQHGDIVTPSVPGGEYVAHLYVVRTERRSELRQHLENLGIDSDIHYPIPDHRQASLSGSYDNVNLPESEAHAATALTLPCFPEMTEGEVAAVIDACNTFQ